jgi:multidrug efflux pump subunit AcrA (membrane-fusion protein)
MHAPRFIHRANINKIRPLWKMIMYNGCHVGSTVSDASRNRHRLHALLLLLSPIACGAVDAAHATEPLVIESALLRLTQQVEVPARAQGVLSSMHIAEGDAVEQGALLAQIDDVEASLLEGRAEIELQLNQEKVRDNVAIRSAQKAVAFNEAESERLERAAQKIPRSISASELAELRFRAEQAKLDLEKAKHALRLDQLTVSLKSKELELSKYNVAVRKIVAPINGVVVEVLRQPGEWVEPGEKVVRIVRIDRLRVEGLIHVHKLPPNLQGAPASIAIDVPGRGEVTFSGKVVFVSPEISPVNGQVRIWAEIANKDGILKPGLRPKMMIHPGAIAEQAGASHLPQPQALN